MPQPIAYNSGNPISGSIEKSTLSFTVEGASRDERDYSSSYAGVDWYSTIPPQDGKYVIISASNPPMIWVTADETDAELLITINGLPDRYNQTLFTDTGSALDYLAQNAYFVSRETPNQIDADSMVLNVDAGLESSYPRTGTTWYDLSGYGNDGILTNSPTFNNGGWFEMDATDDQILCGNNTELNFTSEMSHEVWFWRDSNATGNLRLTSKGAGGGGTGQQGFSFFGSDSSIAWSVNVDGVRTNLFSTITTGKWYHIIGTANLTTGEQKVYLNGVETNSGTLGGSITMASNIQFIIGSYFTPSNLLVWDGKIGLVKLYNKALSESDVKQNYYGGPIVTDGLVFAVDAGNLVSYESGSSTVYNLTGSDSGTLENGVTFEIDGGGTFGFDGSDDKISFTPSSTYNTSALTIEYWAKLSNDGSRHIILANWSGYAVEVSSTLYPYITWWDGASQLTTPQSLRLTENEWGHVTSTWDGTDFKTYVNGELSGTYNNSTISYGVYVREMSATTFGGGAVNGQIGGFRQYNRALNETEIQQNYSATKQKYLF